MADKSKAQKLKEKLFLKRKNGGEELSEEILKKTQTFAKGYKNFLNITKTERECVSYTIEKAEKFGFFKFDKNKKYNPGDKIYLSNRGSAIALAVFGKAGLKNGARIAAAHIDAPRLDLKPNPIIEDSDLALFKTHYYGGIKKYQWTAVPLSLHGKIVRKDGTSVYINVGEKEDEPCFCVSDLLPHLAQDQMKLSMKDAIPGENLNVLIGSLPFKDDEISEKVKLNILNILNEKYDIIEGDFVAADLHLVPAFKAQDVGFDRSMIGGYGHDDRSCAYPCLEAIFEVKTPESTVISFLVDKEEVGSDGNTGMQSDFLKNFIADLSEMENLTTRDVFSKTKCLSADVNAAFDPTYASSFDKNNSTHLNRGVVVTKYTGGRGKCDTSDASAEFTGEIRKLFDENEIIWQSGELGKVDTGGGGTIAKFLANLNMDVIDVGVPVLSMHAPFEVISKIDLYMTFRAIEAFFKEF